MLTQIRETLRNVSRLVMVVLIIAVTAQLVAVAALCVAVVALLKMGV